MAHMAVDPAFARRAEIISHATEALDGQVNAMQWLNEPNRALANRTPLEFLSNGSYEDMQKIDDLLTALEHGIYV
jgi:putative toxin-antitoxin system antitoxin component (TIGR02293 family)